MSKEFTQVRILAANALSASQEITDVVEAAYGGGTTLTIFREVVSGFAPQSLDLPAVAFRPLSHGQVPDRGDPHSIVQTMGLEIYLNKDAGYTTTVGVKTLQSSAILDELHGLVEQVIFQTLAANGYPMELDGFEPETEDWPYLTDVSADWQTYLMSFAKAKIRIQRILT